MNYESYVGKYGAWKDTRGQIRTGEIIRIDEKTAYIEGTNISKEVPTDELMLLAPVYEVANMREYVEMQRKVETLTKQRDMLAEQARLRLYATDW